MPCLAKSRPKSTRIDPKLHEIFDRLKAVLLPQTNYLRVLENSRTKYALGCDFTDGRRKRTMMISAVYIRKDYVSICLGTAHMDPASANAMSLELSEHRRGMTCFHFREMDEKLFQELEVIAECGFDTCCDRGLLPVGESLTRA